MATFQRQTQRKATIEIQRRPGGGRGGGVAGQQGGRNAASGPAAAVNEPADILRILTDIYAPEAFDEKSSLLACNFPSSVGPGQCRNFMNWSGPVVRVERAPSVAQESNFVVVYASPDHAAKVLNAPLVYDEAGTLIVTRLVDIRPTVWTQFSTYISGLMGGR